MPRTAPSLLLALLVAGAPLPALASDAPSEARSGSATPSTLKAQAAAVAQAERPDQATADSDKAAADKAKADDAQPTAPPTPAPPPIAVSSGGEIGFYNKYLWRGFILADAVSMQPTYWVKFADAVTVSSWMNVARDQLEGPLTEHDLTVDYTKTLNGKWTVSGGWINYVFPGLDAGAVTNEIYGGLTHASYLNPTVKAYVDFHEGDGTYLNFSVSHTYALGSQGFAATPSFALGYNNKQWIDDASWSDANFGLKLTVPTPIKKLFLTPAIYYSKSLNDDFFDDHFIGGIGIVTKLF
jgi:hypothetical protein